MENKVTAKGLEKLKKELEERIAKKPALIASIEEMRSRGDLSENDGYTIALDNNETNERKIGELQHLVDNAVIITDSDNSLVSVGNTVKASILGKEVEYEVVGDSESDPLSGKISKNSPIGQALLGKKVGETAKVELPRGTQEYTIIEIS